MGFPIARIGLLIYPLIGLAGGAVVGGEAAGLANVLACAEFSNAKSLLNAFADQLR